MNCLLYILENEKGRHYIGITGLGMDERLKKHNKGGVLSTKFGRPWRVLYHEEYYNYKTAREQEKKVKSWHCGNAFNKFLRTAAGSSNGRTAAFGAANLRSNRRPGAFPNKKKGLEFSLLRKTSQPSHWLVIP